MIFEGEMWAHIKKFGFPKMIFEGEMWAHNDRLFFNHEDHEGNKNLLKPFLTF
jgi:hypothetical protein